MPDTRLQDRVAIITGSSSGIGRATALRFAAVGARVVCADLQPGRTADEITEKFGADRGISVRCDVTSEEDVKALVEKAVAFGGRLDIMCNFAGLQRDRLYPGARVHDLPTAEFDRTLAVNTRGVWLCCKYAIAQMLAQEAGGENRRGERTRGWIVNGGSIAGRLLFRNDGKGTNAFTHTPTYVPSKFAVVGMTKQMALDYATDRIHINCVCPGFVKTPMLEEFASTAEAQQPIANIHPWKALGEPEDVADATLFLCSDEAAWVTGHILHVDGGFSAK